VAARRSLSAVYVIRASGWALEGKVLCYHNGDATRAVPVETDPTFSPGNLEILFQEKYRTGGASELQLSLTHWDIHPDGNKFLMIKEPERTEDETQAEESAAPAPSKIIIVTNWLEELKQKMSVK
jgi:hypothetical protein